MTDRRSPQAGDVVTLGGSPFLLHRPLLSKPLNRTILYPLTEGGRAPSETL